MPTLWMLALHIRKKKIHGWIVHPSVGKLKMRATQRLLLMCVGISVLRLFWLTKQETVNILKVKKMHMDKA